jgi:hypothetical protein
MSTPVSLLIMLAAPLLIWFELRTLVRERKSGVPYLFWWPHPAYRNRPVNRQSALLLFSTASHIFGILVLGMVTFLAVLYLLESLGVIYQ